MLSARRCAHPWRLVSCAAVGVLGYLTSHCLPERVALTVAWFCTTPSGSISDSILLQAAGLALNSSVEAAAGTAGCLTLGFCPGLLGLEWENSMMYPPVKAVVALFLSAFTTTRSLPCSTQPNNAVFCMMTDRAGIAPGT